MYVFLDNEGMEALHNFREQHWTGGWEVGFQAIP